MATKQVTALTELAMDALRYRLSIAESGVYAEKVVKVDREDLKAILACVDLTHIKKVKDAIADQEQKLKNMEHDWHTEKISDMTYQRAHGELNGLKRALRLIKK